MSQLTTEQVLAMIQEAAERGQPVDLRGRDLIGIDLSRETVRAYADRYPKAISEYPGGVNLDEANLERAYLADARLEGARLVGAHLEGAWLGGAHLEGVLLVDAHLERARLDMAHLEEANLWWAHLEEAMLGGAHLEGANLVGANLEGAWFAGAHLEGDRLWEARLEGARLTDSALRGARFYTAYLDKTRFTRAELGRRVEKRGDEEVFVENEPVIGEEAAGNWSQAKEAYLALKQNFQSLGRYEDARWAYVKERQMERKSFFPSEAGDRWLAGASNQRPAPLKPVLGVLRWLRLLLWPSAPPDVHPDRPKWLRNLFWEWLALYGESIWRPAFWGLAIILLWTLLFAWVGIDNTQGAQDGADYLVFSLRSFATMAFNDLQPANVAAKLLSAFEAMLGVSTLALVMYCLGRRMSGS